LRLNSRFRFAVYAAFAALFVTGAAWLVADAWKDPDGGEIWQTVAANLLMLHGGAAMVTLMFLGALVPLHARRNWRIRNNRPTGTLMLTSNAILVVTAFCLYYVGWDWLRWWVSEVHTAVGLFLPALLLVHVLLGRRSADTAYAGSGSAASRRVPK
jgi:hypothetical protein